MFELVVTVLRNKGRKEGGSQNVFEGVPWLFKAELRCLVLTGGQLVLTRAWALLKARCYSFSCGWHATVP